jgi:hypothetical protein
MEEPRWADHTLIGMRHKSSLMNVRSFRGTNIDTDHFLVMSKLRSRTSNSKRGREAKFKRCDTDKLEGVDVSSQYKQKINSEINRSEEKSSEDVNEQRDVTRTAIITSGEEIPGVVEKPKIREWFDEECGAATPEKSKAYT